MSAKSMRKSRLYNVLPRASRVRSNSLSSPSPRSLYTGPSSSTSTATSLSSTAYPLSFFDGPPPPPPPSTTSRPGNPLAISTTHLPNDASSKSPTTQAQSHSQPRGPALSAPPIPVSNTPSPGILPYSPFNTVPFHQVAQRKGSQVKRHRVKYTLDVGAYGMPKRRGNGGSRTESHSEQEHSSLSVQVGEDAYFVRGNAMGVADGVGGWARSKHASEYLPARKAAGPSPSALFARRLMHFCSTEIAEASSSRSSPTSAYPSRSTSPNLPISDSLAHPNTLQEALDEQLGDLEDGLDVLMILERAFEKTCKAHVVTPAEPSMFACNGAPNVDPDGSGELQEKKPGESELSADSSGRSSTSSKSTPAPSLPPPPPTPAPLLCGSSTALLAVLDQPPTRPSPRTRVSSTTSKTRPIPISPRRQTLSTSTRTPDFSCVASSSSLGASSRTPSTSANQLHQLRYGASITGPWSREFDRVPVFGFASSSLPSVGPYGGSVGWEEGHVGGRLGATGLEIGGEVEAEAVLKIAHVGDCMGLLVRGGDVVWRSEEMWWAFNTPVQLGPQTPFTARSYSVPVQRDDVLILASDGLSDNVWEEDVVEEVRRVLGVFLGQHSGDGALTERNGVVVDDEGVDGVRVGGKRDMLRRRTMAGMLSEALCLKARSVVECGRVRENARRSERGELNSTLRVAGAGRMASAGEEECGGDGEVPFARRAREAGRVFSGGKDDDISVVVAIVSPTS